MKHRTIVTTALAGVATATLVVGSASLAVAATNTQAVRQSDFTALSDTRSSGSYTFLKEGLKVVTTDSSSQAKVAEYFPLSGGIPTNGSYDWTGTAAQPGSQIVFNADGDDSTTVDNYNVLVGEQVYSTNPRGGDLTDWWYTGGAAKATDRGVTCPSTTSGSGSDCHGTLAEWAAAVPNAKVYAGGFSLGSGVQGEGVLRSLTFGDTEYVFTSEAATPTPVTDDVDPATASGIAVNGLKAKVTMASEDQPAGTERGDKLVWTVVVDGKQKFTTTQDYSETDTYVAKFARGTGKHTVELLADGASYQTVTVKTGR